jgi:hypothetical protein
MEADAVAGTQTRAVAVGSIAYETQAPTLQSLLVVQVPTAGSSMQ